MGINKEELIKEIEAIDFDNEREYYEDVYKALSKLGRKTSRIHLEYFWGNFDSDNIDWDGLPKEQILKQINLVMKK